MKTGDGIRAKKSSLAGLNNMGRERLTNRLANMGRGDMANMGRGDMANMGRGKAASLGRGEMTKMEMGEEWQNRNRGMIPRF